VKERPIKKLTLNKESILRLDPSVLREAVGGATRGGTATELCTESCGAGNTCLC
jgi:hypothetical protein